MTAFGCSAEFALREALREVFQQTNATVITYQVGKRTITVYRKDVVREVDDDGTQNDPHERLS